MRSFLTATEVSPASVLLGPAPLPDVIVCSSASTDFASVQLLETTGLHCALCCCESKVAVKLSWRSSYFVQFAHLLALTCRDNSVDQQARSRLVCADSIVATEYLVVCVRGSIYLKGGRLCQLACYGFLLYMKMSTR